MNEVNDTDNADKKEAKMRKLRYIWIFLTVFFFIFFCGIYTNGRTVARV